MPKRDFKNWMWFEAVDMLARAERLQQQFFTVRHHTAHPAWEPPVDVLETETEVLIFFALPGVDPDSVEVALEAGTLVVRGRRVLPDELRTAMIHRLELPQGHFERRVPLPPNHYDTMRRRATNGCLLISLNKAA
jgi:HSP20 family molecular chaperone IbpA